MIADILALSKVLNSQKTLIPFTFTQHAMFFPLNKSKTKTSIKLKIINKVKKNNKLIME